MKSRLARAMALVIVVVATAPAIGAELNRSPIQIKIAEQGTSISRAGLATNALAIATLLINPKDVYKPIPLYGYKPSSLNIETLSAALTLAAQGKVHVAAVNTAQNSPYQGRPIRVFINANPQRKSKQQITADFTKQCQSCLIAFTQPLRNVKVDAKFITTPHLWSKFTSAQ